MKPTEMREMSEEELVDKEAELKDQLFKLKFQNALGQLENTMKLNAIKKDLARIKTIQNESRSEDRKERKQDK
jgi:large subunit ribosomal protein L29